MRCSGMHGVLPLCLFTILVIFSLYWISDTTEASEEGRFAQAQALVERIVSTHPEIVRLSIHAVPAGEKQNRIIACNIKEKIGMPSDPEDLEVMRGKRIVVLKKGTNLDVTLPILDRSGRPIGTAGVTLPLRRGQSEEQVVERVRFIARFLNSAIQDAGGPLW